MELPEQSTSRMSATDRQPGASARPRLIQPGFMPYVPGLERYRARGGGACVVALAPGDEIALSDREGHQDCEVVVLAPGGGGDVAALGLKATGRAVGLAALVAAGLSSTTSMR